MSKSPKPWILQNLSSNKIFNESRSRTPQPTLQNAANSAWHKQELERLNNDLIEIEGLPQPPRLKLNAFITFLEELVMPIQHRQKQLARLFIKAITGIKQQFKLIPRISKIAQPKKRNAEIQTMTTYQLLRQTGLEEGSSEEMNMIESLLRKLKGLQQSKLISKLSDINQYLQNFNSVLPQPSVEMIEKEEISDQIKDQLRTICGNITNHLYIKYLYKTTSKVQCQTDFPFIDDEQFEQLKQENAELQQQIMQSKQRIQECIKEADQFDLKYRCEKKKVKQLKFNLTNFEFNARKAYNRERDSLLLISQIKKQNKRKDNAIKALTKENEEFSQRLKQSYDRIKLLEQQIFEMQDILAKIALSNQELTQQLEILKQNTGNQKIKHIQQLSIQPISNQQEHIEKYLLKVERLKYQQPTSMKPLIFIQRKVFELNIQQKRNYEIQLASSLNIDPIQIEQQIKEKHNQSTMSEHHPRTEISITKNIKMLNFDSAFLHQDNLSDNSPQQDIVQVRFRTQTQQQNRRIRRFQSEDNNKRQSELKILIERAMIGHTQRCGNDCKHLQRALKLKKKFFGSPYPISKFNMPLF